MPTAQSTTPQAAGDLFNFNLQRRDIRQIHRIRFHNPRALHDCLRSVQARQAGAARLPRQAAQLKAVAVFKPAVRGRVDDEGNILRREHIVDIRRIAGDFVDRLSRHARCHERLARAGRCIEPYRER